MPLKTKRWNDPVEPDDGWRLLVCRYRPRGVRKADETWDSWCPNLGPSRQLHAALYGKHGPPMGFEPFTCRYRAEMTEQHELIAELAAMLHEGKTITLLCSSACVNPQRCHRTLLVKLIEQQLALLEGQSPTPSATAAPPGSAIGE
ncbi:MAG: DUF488 family protein [Planctomycetia bacterium]|nr:DUF488 family protein [Planctomycetia bacterium]